MLSGPVEILHKVQYLVTLRCVNIVGVPGPVCDCRQTSQGWPGSKVRHLGVKCWSSHISGPDAVGSRRSV